MSTPVAGQIIKGKYRVDRVLGQGGMGVVVAGHHLALDQRVAMKFVHPTMLEHPEFLARFSREARAASKIESEHVARVMDVDTLEDGTPFMVMEYLEGVDLSTVRKGGQPLHATTAVGYLLEACEAIGEAHRLGIVHRDLKPANLFLARRSDGRVRVKVLDFGISKMAAAGTGDASVTQTASVMGSAEYMSPEQMMSARDVDARADIWALGVTLYELVTGRVPFPGETITHVCALVMGHVPEPASRLSPGLPLGLDAVIDRCLEKHRERRFASVAELVAALQPFARGEAAAAPQQLGTHPHAFAVPGGGGTATVGNSAPSVSLTAAPRPRSKAPVVVGAAVLLGLAGAAFLAFRASPRTDAAASASTSAAALSPASAAPGLSSGPAVTPAPPANADPSPAAADSASPASPSSSGPSSRAPARRGADGATPKRPPPSRPPQAAPTAAPVAPPKPTGEVHKID